MTPNNHADDPYFTTLESILRVSLAGFGGALAGLSFARRGRLAAASSAATSAANRSSGVSNTRRSGSGSRIVVSNASLGGSTTASTNNVGKKRLQRQLTPIVRTIPPSTKPYVDRELPVAWALACMTFAGIVEGTRIISPTSMIWKSTTDDNSSKSTSSDCAETTPFMQLMNEKEMHSSMVTISDYMVGGAVAGAIFKGSAVRSTAGAKMDASIIMGISASRNSPIRGRAMSGILPGAVLGLLAGVAIVAMDHAQVFVIQYLDHGGDDDDDGVYHEIEVGLEIPDDIKAMSNEELMKSIENLKTSMSDTSRQKDDVEQVPGARTDENNEVRDLISMLGFRPYPS